MRRKKPKIFLKIGEKPISDFLGEFWLFRLKISLSKDPNQKMPDTSQHDSSDDKKKVSTNIGEQHLQAIKAMKYLQPIIQIILYIPNTHAPWMRGGSVLISHS